MSRRVRLHIDRIVLHGVDPGDKRAFRTAVQNELVRLLGTPAAQGQFDRSRTAGRIDGGRVGPSRKPAELGRSVARAAFNGVKSS